MSPVPAAVDRELIAYFKGKCAKPSLVKDKTSNVKHLCGFDDNPMGWRLQAAGIRQLPSVKRNQLTLRGSDMDTAKTIADIESKLKKKPASSG